MARPATAGFGKAWERRGKSPPFVLMTARYWAASDREDDDAEYWRDRQAEQEAAYDAMAEHEDYDHYRRRLRTERDSPRRQVLFRRAQGVISVMVAVRGVYTPPITVTAWYGRHGRRLGLFTYYDKDREIQWRPRTGFRIIEIEDIPF